MTDFFEINEKPDMTVGDIKRLLANVPDDVVPVMYNHGKHARANLKRVRKVNKGLVRKWTEQGGFVDYETIDEAELDPNVISHSAIDPNVVPAVFFG